MHVIVSYLRPLCFALVSFVVKIYSLLGQPLVVLLNLYNQKFQKILLRNDLKF